MSDETRWAVSARVQPEWTERRAAQVRAAIERRVRRRRASRWAVSGSSLVLAGALVVALWVRPRPQPMPAPSAALPSPVKPAEPSATPLTADTELVVDPQGSGRAFVLRRGSARFVVTHDERPFRVRVGRLIVEDLGTVFSVARLDDHQINVAVEEGRVAVLCEDSRVELGTRQSRTFVCGAPEQASPVAVAPPRAQPTTDPAKAGKPSAAPSRSSAPAWKILAESGQYHEAYDSLHRESEAPVRDEAHDLLLAADTSRLSGHSREAVPYLQRVLIRHGQDPRAHLAAFTLGRVLLDELGQAADAAEAFERARATRSPLAEDALARAIEAWARAGNRQRAHDLALEYQRSYPQGRRMRAVTQFGGLE
jgi:transmembrane sensor